jgi:hypothetical protein
MNATEYLTLEPPTPIQSGDELFWHGKWVVLSAGGHVTPDDLVRRKCEANPEEGYRYLEVGETLEDGDEYCGPHGWAATKAFGRVVFPRRYRRKIKDASDTVASAPEAGDGYRLLELGETLEKGDEWWTPLRGWIPTTSVGACALPYYRRKLNPEPRTCYRLLEVGEPILIGDAIYCSEDGERWLPFSRGLNTSVREDEVIRRPVSRFGDLESAAAYSKTRNIKSVIVEYEHNTK